MCVVQILIQAINMLIFDSDYVFIGVRLYDRHCSVFMKKILLDAVVLVVENA